MSLIPLSVHIYIYIYDMVRQRSGLSIAMPWWHAAALNKPDSLSLRYTLLLSLFPVVGELQCRREFLKSSCDVSVTTSTPRDILPLDSQAMIGLYADSDDVSICVRLIGGERWAIFCSNSFSLEPMLKIQSTYRFQSTYRLTEYSVLK